MGEIRRIYSLMVSFAPPHVKGHVLWRVSGFTSHSSRSDHFIARSQYNGENKALALDRRQSLHVGLALVLTSFGARASSADSIDPAELPRDFVNLAYDLIDALRDSIDADLSGAPEREVRRKADPAKDLVKRYINTWSGASAIADSTACQEIRTAVQELGEFYRVNGQRQRMTDSVAASILKHLETAESALPEKKEKSIFPF